MVMVPLTMPNLSSSTLAKGAGAVGGAGRVGHNVGGGVVVIRVHADDVGGDVVALGGGGDDNLLGASLDVLAGAGAVEEDTGALDDEVDVHLLPGEVEGVASDTTAMFLPLTEMVESSTTFTSASKVPRMESYLRR